METNKIIQGDALEVLKTLPSESIDCVITSPPYWALRDYGVKGQLGLEQTFQEYITKLCDIFDEVKRVLKKEGTCWVNIGDTYSGSGVGQKDTGKASYEENDFRKEATKTFLPDKSLCNIPARFSIEMQDRGWILRNEIIWHKPNCMPSSADDRFTVDFEKVFFFVKSKKYHFEQQLEKAIWAEKDYRSQIEGGVLSGGKTATGEYATKRVAYSKKVKDSVKFFGEGSGNPGGGLYGSTLGGITPNMEMGLKNKRAVWRINTKGYSEAHFATYPEALVEPMIKAGCPQFVCKKCGKAREKIIEKETSYDESKFDRGGEGVILGRKKNPHGGLSSNWEQPKIMEKGLTDCGCNEGVSGGIVLDIFMGSGTTAIVALQLDRKYLGIELNSSYIDIANKRIEPWLAKNRLF